jgi:hypothetical protein
VLLVDRQPVQGVSNHLVGEAGTVVLPRLEFSGAVIDPPWYPAVWRKWTAWAASAVGADCEVIVSIWPEDTRPSAAIELSLLRDWLSQWADFEKLDFASRYDTPQFEQIAHSVGTPRSMALVLDMDLYFVSANAKMPRKNFSVRKTQVAAISDQ